MSVYRGGLYAGAVFLYCDRLQFRNVIFAGNVIYYTVDLYRFDLIYGGGQQMRYLSVTETAKKWNVSERSVRNYCALDRVPGAFLTGKTWKIPENAEKPERINKKKEEPVTLLDILEFHVNFERIHPFQDGNGRVGRLILFKECLKYNIVPFIIEDDLKLFYYRGLKEWDNEKWYLTDTCLTAQDRYKVYLNYFRIGY